MRKDLQIENFHYLCAMIIAFFILFTLATIGLDFLAWRRISPTRRTARTIVGITLLILNILPHIAVAITAIADNTTQQLIAFDSWALTIYIIATLTRVVYYVAMFTIRHKFISRAVGIVAASALLAILLNGVIVTRTKLTVKNIQIVDNDIPQSFVGYRILFISDLHIGAMVQPERECKALADIIGKQCADMVIVGGDLVHISHNELTESLSAQLSRIVAPDGVYYAFGNHDTGIYMKSYTEDDFDSNIWHLRNKIADMGWTPLQDSTIYAVKGADSIAVTGIDFTRELLKYKHSYNRPEDYPFAQIFDNVPKEVFNIAISHLPQLWEPISSCSYADLVLSGHTHATQIAFECFGRRISPAMVLHKQWSGLYSDQNSQLYITDGIGCVGFNMRIGAVPEVTIIELAR